MKNNTEIKRTQYTIDQLVNHHLIYTGFTINDENYGVDDAWLISLKHTAFPLENKTILGDFNFKEDGAFRSYFKEDLPNKMQETLNNLNNDNAQDLKEAFLGYGYDNVSHKTEFGAKGKRQWEKKALLDLSRGFFIPCKTPKELITKNYN